jgi:hypothetical protein
MMGVALFGLLAGTYAGVVDVAGILAADYGKRIS